MNTKTYVWFGMFFGSLIGTFIPELWGAGALSFSSLVFSSIGAVVGVFIGFKLSQY